MKKPHALHHGWLLPTLLGISLASSHAATLFSFQQSDLRKDGVLYGAGSSYSGAFDGSVTDQSPTGTATTNTQDRIGNQLRAASGNVGSNGQQWSGLFSFDLTELGDFITANPSFTVASAALTLTSVGGSHAGGSTTIVLYQTEEYSGIATWITSDGTNAWSLPVKTNSTGAVGGGTLVSGSLGGGTVNTTITSGASMTFSSSAAFVNSVDNALARGDKTLFLLVQANNYGSSDSYAQFANNTNATTDFRPELALTLIPEPSTALLGGLGLLALLRRRR